MVIIAAAAAVINIINTIAAVTIDTITICCDH